MGITFLKDLGMKFRTPNDTRKRRMHLYLCDCGIEFEANPNDISRHNQRMCKTCRNEFIGRLNKKQ